MIFREIYKDFLDLFKSTIWRIWMFKLVVVFFACLAFFGGCSYFNSTFGCEDDNPIEDLIEDVIEAKTGIRIDFTP